MGIGEWAALAAALTWTLSSMLWSKVQLSAVSMNLAKNLIACSFLICQLVVLAIWYQQPMWHASIKSVGWLSLSGLIGIVLGDTLFFRSLQILGPRRALMMVTTGPLFAAVLGWAMLDERLAVSAVLGIVLTVVGVIVVISDRKSGQESPGLYPGKLAVGVVCGFLGAVCQAVGGVFSKMGMSDCDPIEAAFLRVAASALIMIVMVTGRRKLVTFGKEMFRWKVLKFVIPAAALGAWCGIWFSQVAYKNSPVGIATTLLSTCPLFAIPIVRYYHGHRISAWSIVGTAVAVCGIYYAVN